MQAVNSDHYSSFILTPTPGRGTFALETFETNLTTAKAKVAEVFKTQFSVLQPLKGYQAQLSKIPVTYDQWKTQIENVAREIGKLRTLVMQIIGNHADLNADNAQVAKASRDLSSLALNVCFLEISNDEIYLFLKGGLHQEALKLYKEKKEACNALQIDPKKQMQQKLYDLEDLLKATVTTIEAQKTVLKGLEKSSKPLKREVTKLHQRILKHFCYCISNYRKVIESDSATENRAAQIRLLDRLDLQCTNMLNQLSLPKLKRLEISDDQRDKVAKFLDETQSVTLEKAEKFRYRWWDPFRILEWYYGDIGGGDVVGPLREIALSIKKLTLHLQTRVSELVQGNLPSIMDLSAEKNFFKACVQELEERLNAKERELYESEFSPKMPAGIYDIDLRHAHLAQARMLIGTFSHLGSNVADPSQQFRSYAETLGLFLSYLSPREKLAGDYITSSEAVGTLFQLITAKVANLTPPPDKPKGYIEFLRYATYTPICRLIANIGQRTLALVGIQETLFEDILTGKPMKDIVKYDHPGELPSEIIDFILKEIMRLRPYSEAATNPKFDIFLYALKSRYAKLWEAGLKNDIQLRMGIASYSKLTEWDSEKARVSLALFYNLYRSLSEIRINPSENDPVKAASNFERYARARQQLIEIKLPDDAPPAVRLRFAELCQEAEMRLKQIEIDQYPEVFAEWAVSERRPNTPSESILQKDIVKCLYKHLLVVLFGSDDAETKKGLSATIHNILKAHPPKEILALLQNKEVPGLHYVGILLFRYLLESLDKVDPDPLQKSLALHPKEFNLLRQFMSTYAREEETRKLWHQQYDVGFMHSCLRHLMQFEGNYLSNEKDDNCLKQWKETVPNLMTAHNHYLWAAVLDSYRIFRKTLDSKKAIQAAELAILQLQIFSADTKLDRLEIPEDPTFGNLLTAADWCRKRMKEEMNEKVIKKD